MSNRISRFLPSASTAVDLAADDALRPAGPAPGPLVRAAVTVRPDEVRPQAGGGPEERVALGHSGPGQRGAQDEAAVARRRTRRRGGPARGTATRRRASPSTLRDDQLADPAVGDERAERRGPRRPPIAGSSAAGQRLERRAAAFEVERRDPVDEHDVGAGRALERPAVGLAAARPGERGAVRVGRVGGGEQVDRAARSAGRPARAPRAAGRARRPARTGPRPSPSTK